MDGIIWREIIVPYFYEDQGQPCTALQGFSGFSQGTWFQQDGVSCQIFGQILRGDLNWSPDSSDLSPMDFPVWGYLKN